MPLVPVVVLDDTTIEVEVTLEVVKPAPDIDHVPGVLEVNVSEMT